MSSRFCVLLTLLVASCSALATAQEHQHEVPVPSAAQHAHHPDMPPAQNPTTPATAPAPTDAAPTESELEHVPPDPPATQVDHSMPYREMVRMMQMDDTSRIGKVTLDRLEWRDTESGGALAWNAAAWYGNDDDKLYLKSEGHDERAAPAEARIEALWDHAFARWWSWQAGMRQDSAAGPARTWAAVGVEGLAPGFFAIEATAYLGESGRAATRLSAERDLLLTQRWILQPEAELNLYSRSDPANGIGSGLSNLELALRLRYEVRREFAPYVGVVWARQLGNSADLRRAGGESADDLQFVAGLRGWL